MLLYHRHAIASGVRIIHVDMDAYYASVEIRDDPSLRGKCVIIGSRHPRSVVSTASYEARKLGVGSAMSMREALERCPHAIVIPPKMEKYARNSVHLRRIFARYSDLVEPISLDEAFIDVSHLTRSIGDAFTIGERIRADIAGELRLTASAGVAENKFLAKIASEEAKPNGIVSIEQNAAAFVAALPIRKMWGVGKKTEKRLLELGIRTFGDVQRMNPAALKRTLGQYGEKLFELAHGRDSRSVCSEHEAKGIGAETTFGSDLYDLVDVEKKLLGQCQRVAARLHAEQIWAAHLTVVVKYGDHRRRSKGRALSQRVQSTDAIFGQARRLLAEFDLSPGVRLVGVRSGSFHENASATQKCLFSSAKKDDRRNEKLEGLRLDLDKRFGRGTLTRARLIDTPKASEDLASTEANVRNPKDSKR